MSNALQPDDFLSSDAEDSAELIPDPEYGYDRVVPIPEVVDRIVSTYCDAIRQAETDWAESNREMMRSEAVYEGKGDPTDLGSVITIPIAKRIINQQNAWDSNAILSKFPVVTVKPLDDGKYTIPTAVQPDGSLQTDEIPAAEAARLYEALLQYKLTERLDFGQLIDDTLYAIRAGENPTYWKIEYQPRTRTIKRKNWVKLTDSDNVIKILGYEDTTIPDGEATTIKHVFGGNCLLPIEQTDIQQSPWFAEKTPMTSLELWKAIKDRKVDFALGPDATPDLSDISHVLGAVTNQQDGEIATALGLIDRLVAEQPDKTHDIRTLWFYYPIRRTVTAQNKDSGEQTKIQVIEIRSLCGKIHYTAKRLLALYVNPYPKRPYVPFWCRKRPHRFSGTSSAQDLAPFQRLISQIFHLQIQNAVQQNVKVFLVRQDSATMRFLTKVGNKLRPGLVIPFGDPTDVKSEQLGAPVESMAGEISYLTGEAGRLSMDLDYTEVPNRLPAATFAQNEAQVKMQPQWGLRAFRRQIGKAIEMYLQTVAQYHEYEVIPFTDPVTQQRVAKLIGFPREVFEQHFSFDITATGDDDTVSSRVERGSMLLKETNVENEAALKLLAVLMNPEVPAQTKEPAIRMLVRLETLYGEMLAATRQDAQKFIMTEDFIRGVVQSVPPPPPPSEPAKEEPRISINLGLSGELPPELVAAVAQMAGIQGAQNAIHLPSTGPGGAGPALPSGPGGSAGPPIEPGNVGMAPADALGNLGSAPAGGGV